MAGRLGTLVASAMLTLSLALTGCGGSGGGAATTSEASTQQADIEAVRKVTQENVDSFMSGVADLSADAWDDDEEMQEMLQTLSLFGIEAEDIVQVLTSSIKMEAGEVTVDGDTATAMVTLTSPDSAGMEVAFEKAGEEIDALDVTGMDTDEALAACGAIIRRALTEDIPTTSHEITFKYERSGDDWTLANREEVEAAIGAA